MNYNNKKFRPVVTSKNGQTTADTVFEYKQEGFILSCEYNGKNILKGQLLGLVEKNGKINFRYQQIDTKGQLMTGICESVPKILSNGKLRLHEKWKWTSGDFSSGNSILEEI